RAPREDPLLADVRLLQPDLLPALRSGILGHASACLDLRARTPDTERFRLGLGIRAGLLDADLHRQPRLLARVRPHPGGGEPLGVPVLGVAAPDAGAGAGLRAH